MLGGAYHSPSTSNENTSIGSSYPLRRRWPAGLKPSNPLPTSPSRRRRVLRRGMANLARIARSPTVRSARWANTRSPAKPAIRQSCQPVLICHSVAPSDLKKLSIASTATLFVTIGRYRNPRRAYTPTTADFRAQMHHDSRRPLAVDRRGTTPAAGRRQSLRQRVRVLELVLEHGRHLVCGVDHQLLIQGPDAVSPAIG